LLAEKEAIRGTDLKGKGDLLSRKARGRKMGWRGSNPEGGTVDLEKENRRQDIGGVEGELEGNRPE